MSDTDTLLLVIDGEHRLSYDKRQRLPGIQRRFLDQMDADMDGGIRLDGTQVDDPDADQRLHYVALTLVRAALDANDNLQLACCAYLGDRHPRLVQVVAAVNADRLSLDLAFSPVPPAAG